LIMAGGSGERFWPLSTPSKPKQLLKLFSSKTMIRETVDRILPLLQIENVFVATNILQSDEIMKELPDIPKDNIIIEPAFKDTAAGIGYGALIIENRFLMSGRKIVIVVLASDHLIKKGDQLCEVLRLASVEAHQNNIIVTLGVKPDRPETGYGYIEVDNTSTEPILLNQSIHKVKRFREKPNKETAEEYLNSGKHMWNSGMFIFAPATIFGNFNTLLNDHMLIFNDLRKIIARGLVGVELSNESKKCFEKFEKISIDFGIMERSTNIRVIPVDIDWSDIGSFTALEEVFPKDNYKNVVRDTVVISQDSENNIVLATGSVVSLLGVEDLIVVRNGDNILVCHKTKAQDIKKIVSQYSKLPK